MEIPNKKLAIAKPAVDTQSQRRVKYGFNVLVAVIAAVAITIVINWISYRNFRAGTMRWDLTSTRQYSLSPLTRKVLERFDGEFRIVTMLDPAESMREDTQHARDLVEEYARASGKVKVEHINAATDLEKRKDFEKSLAARFADRHKPMVELITRGVKAMEAAHRDLVGHRATINKALDDENLGKNDPRRATLFQLERFLGAQSEGLDKAIKAIAAYDSVPLPRYSQAVQGVKETFDSLDNTFYPSVLKSVVNPIIEDSKAPARVKDELIGLSERVSRAMADRRALRTELFNAQNVPQYDMLMLRLSQPNPLVIMSPTDVVAINLAELFRSPSAPVDPENQGAKEENKLEEKQFLGEERLTGVLARMTISQLKQAPMVIFVALGNGQGGRPQVEYKQLRDRLMGMNLDVQIWEPAKQSPFAQPGTRAQPAPQPAPGQRAVWILLPADPPDPQNPNADRNVQIAVSVVRERLIHGDGVLAITAPEVQPAALSSAILDDWRVSVDHQSVILREGVNRFGQNTAYNQHEVRQWPLELPITKAIGEAGMTARFDWCSPLKVADVLQTGQTWFPLVELKGDTLWANLSTGDEFRAARSLQFDAAADKRAPSFTIAVAMERPVLKDTRVNAKDGDKVGEKEGDAAADARTMRLVVVSDPMFATDNYGAAEFEDPATKRKRQITPYPGNHELFVNSVYWLAGLEELIAASARTQEVRRIAAMKPAELSALQWTLLIGMPLGTFVVGVGVWFTRRG